MKNARIAKLVPEVIQTSLMDCGPAALKAVLEGFGIPVHYEALRDRCQTDVDGTSIDAIAKLGAELGLATSEVVVPHDSVLLPEAKCLPAIVVQSNAAGLLHFVVLWNVVGPFVQIMDPGSGRRWVPKSRFLSEMPFIPVPITTERWRRWVSSEDSLSPLRAKMRLLGVSANEIDTLIAKADADSDWFTFAALDAAVRMIAKLVAGRAIAHGREASRLLSDVLDRAIDGKDRPYEIIPKSFWWATPSGAEKKLTVHAALIVHFERGDVSSSPVTIAHRVAPSMIIDPIHTTTSSESAGALPRSWKARLAEPKLSPMGLLWDLVRYDSPRALAVVTAALIASVMVAGTDVVLLRSLFDAAIYLTLDYQRALGALVLIAFALGAFLLDYFVASEVSRLGLALEMRLRVGFLEKLPKLEDRYLRTRPTSDMTARGHAMHLLRDVPLLGARIARAFLSLVVTALGIVWLYPHGAIFAIAAAIVGPLAFHLLRRPLVESTLRARTQAGALERFYLDALLGVIPVRVHGAERAVRREHESLLVEWTRSGRDVQRQTTWVQAAQSIVSMTIAVAIVGSYVLSGAPASGLLLIVFWALRLPTAGQELAAALVATRNVHNVALRLFAPLAAREVEGESKNTEDATELSISPILQSKEVKGVDIALDAVTVKAGGHTLLRNVSVTIAAGNHVAIVGASGAGKSTLVSLLLGWLDASEGTVKVDGEPLDAARLARLRREVAWVDPAVHLWNRTLLENIVFGEEDGLARLPRATALADLTNVLQGLPEGLQANVGEGGTRISGGQGQRVRIARAHMRDDARLVILDEPFRGLERAQRRELLRRAREAWKNATILFVSHDVGDTLDMDRVLVVESGAIVEDGEPKRLMHSTGSRFRALAEADRALHDGVWSKARWQNKRLDHGKVVDAREAS